MGILQARILEWVAMSSFRGSSQPRDWTCVPFIAGDEFFTVWTTREAHGWLTPTPNSMTRGHLEFFGFELGLAPLFVSLKQNLSAMLRKRPLILELSALNEGADSICCMWRKQDMGRVSPPQLFTLGSVLPCLCLWGHTVTFIGSLSFQKMFNSVFWDCVGIQRKTRIL